jgi:arsenate reductase (thioredoxin)
MTGDTLPFRILVLCTGNSARSQMAEALINARGQGRVVAESAGSEPAARVNQLAIETLRQAGIAWQGHQPRPIDDLVDQRWDAVITVCDKAREACPIFPGHPIMAHWGMPDPAAVVGDDDIRRRAFHDALVLLQRRIELMLALPIESLQRMALEARLRAIGTAAGPADAAASR